MQISGQKFDTRSSLRGSHTLWGWLCGRVELIMPLQAFHSNLTYAVLCTITSFEALIKGMSSNGARKQKQKQRNKWFSSDPSLMFTSRSSLPLCRPTSHCLLLISFSSQPPHHHLHQGPRNHFCHRNATGSCWTPVGVTNTAQTLWADLLAYYSCFIVTRTKKKLQHGKHWLCLNKDYLIWFKVSN